MAITYAATAATVTYFLMLQVNYNYNLEKARFAEEQKERPTSQRYDFIIAGAGTAGCLLANRLSKRFSVLLLEAGAPAPSLTEVRELRGAINIDELNYIYKTTQQKYCGNKMFTLSQGKMMGGSFTHNGLLYNRGCSRDYDNWAKLTNDNTWKYSNIYKVFRSLEKYTGPFQSHLRGTDGPLIIETDTPAILPTYKKAAEELGISYGDANGWQKEGVYPEDFNADKMGHAVTTCSALIDPILGIRKTLTVHTYSEVTKILFTSTNKAIGVEYVRFGKTFNAYAKKDVIISSGAFGSPLLLFKSGVGPMEMLAKAKIDTVADLPVGKNLQDHVLIFVDFTYNNKGVTNPFRNDDSTGVVWPKSISRGERNRSRIFVEHGAGPEAFFVSDIAKSGGETNWPDIQMQHAGETDDGAGTTTVQILFILGRPKSLGSIELNTELYLSGERSNTKLAVIDYNLLKEKEDTDALIQGIRKGLQLYKTNAFKSLKFAMFGSGCSNPTDSDAYWRCVIQATVSTPIHPSGSCRMGFGDQDPNSVVDSNFRVLKVRNLRVVDSSVFPKITNGNINAPTIVVAEVAARKILAEYK